MQGPEVNLPCGWRDAWLMRTLPVLKGYTIILTSLLSSACLSILCRNFRLIASNIGELGRTGETEDVQPSQAISETLRLRKVLRRCQTITGIYLFNLFIIYTVDAILGVMILHDSIRSEPESWTLKATRNFAVETSWPVVPWVTVLFLTPIIQMLSSTLALATLSTKRSSNILADYADRIAFFSTHVALFWSMLAFVQKAWYSLLSEGTGIPNFLAEGALLGSAWLWLEVSLTFTNKVAKMYYIELDKPGPLASTTTKIFCGTFTFMRSKFMKYCCLPGDGEAGTGKKVTFKDDEASV